MAHHPSLDNQITGQLPDRTSLVQALAEFRQELQRAANKESLINFQVPAALLLADIADRLSFTNQERCTMLGEKLAREIYSFLEQPVRQKLAK